MTDSIEGVLIAWRRCFILAGGTFALYAQLRRQGTKAARGGPNDEVERPAKPDWRQRLIESKRAQGVLRILVVFGVGAIMGDGVLTPVGALQLWCCFGVSSAVVGLLCVHADAIL